MMKRKIYNELLVWKADKDKKSLLLRGARQIGKTHIVRELGKTFTHFLEVNFESTREIHSFFAGNLDPEIIGSKLSAYYQVPVIDGKTLLFFDEVQSCPDALISLRYFYEKRPGLHVVATGSLLEFGIREIPSFGVGRIRSLFMHPMSFNEFLMASNMEGIWKEKLDADPEKPVHPVFHVKLLELLKNFLLIGGMPKVVSTFLKGSDFLGAQKVLDDIILTLEDDFKKYGERVNVSRLKSVFGSIIRQTGNKFNLASSSQTGNQEQKQEALEMLIMSGLAYRVNHSSGNGLPLGSEINHKKYKVLFFDTGIFQRILGLKLSDILLATKLTDMNRGNIAEVFVGNEILKYNSPYTRPELYYWHREKRGSNAEVDYLLEQNYRIVPVEVKSGVQGKMQSLHLFMTEKCSEKGVRVSMENFSEYDKIFVYPIYGVDRLVEEG